MRDTGIKFRTAAEIQAEYERDLRERPEELMEARYRCGYHDGFIEAVNALGDLFQRRVSKWDAYNRLFDHWEGPLFWWTHRDCSKKELPPRVDGMR